jgi:alcohol dehydrogenase class IV
MITALGYSNGDYNKAVSYLINLINNLKKQLGVAESFREHGVSEAAYKSKLPGFIKYITEAPMLPALLSNPQECTAENTEELFATCYFGKKPPA